MNAYNNPTYGRSNNFFNSIPPITRNIIIINSIVWLATFLLERQFPAFFNALALHYIGSESFQIYQFLTYMFMHGSWTHIFFNMFAVFMFGAVIERSWGPKKFLFYYLFTGIGAALVQELMWHIDLSHLVSVGQNAVKLGQYMVPLETYANIIATVGASGAVFGILIAFGMLYPNSELFIMFIPIPIKAKYFVILYGVVELFMGVKGFEGDNVAHFAHLGGMLFGLVLILYWKYEGSIERKIKEIIPNSRKKSKSKLKVEKTGNIDYDYNLRKAKEDAEIDKILEKIKKSGYSSLSEEEKKKLFDRSNK